MFGLLPEIYRSKQEKNGTSVLGCLLIYSLHSYCMVNGFKNWELCQNHTKTIKETLSIIKTGRCKAVSTQVIAGMSSIEL